MHYFLFILNRAISEYQNEILGTLAPESVILRPYFYCSDCFTAFFSYIVLKF